MALAQITAPHVAPLNAELLRRGIARLQALPAFYPAVQKALRTIDDPNSTNEQVQQVICLDQAMAARVLQLANSAYFGFYQQVATVSLAIALIGRQKIATLLLRFLSDGLLGMLSARKPAARYIRELSVATAAAAHLLAERLMRSDKEEIQLAGLLHNIGELVLLSQFRDRYEEMLGLEAQLSRPEAEAAVFGVESRLVGKWLLEGWNFPAFFPAVVEHCADPWTVHFPAAPVAAIAIVHTARGLAEAWSLSRPQEAVQAILSPRLARTLEIDRHFLEDVYTQLPERIPRFDPGP